MDRRRFLVTSLAGVVAGPLTAEAQQTAVRSIGIIGSAPRTLATDSAWEAFVAALREHGWVERRNLIIERRYAEPRKQAALEATEELMRLRVDVIVVAATQTALAAKEATHTLPIVMTVPADPVAVGLVASLARPGGNVTGLSLLGTEVAGKQVELLKEAVTGLASIGVLMNPTNASHAPRRKEIVATARALNLHVHVGEASSRGEIPKALKAMVKHGIGAALVLGDALFIREAKTVFQLVADQGLPAMYGLREAPLAGGLMSYGPNFSHLFRRAASYVDKILRGAHPRDLPVEQASTLELVINLKTARALGLTIPPSLLARADQVIE